MIRWTDKLGSFLSKLFVVQLATSSLCLCCSIYCLAFVSGIFRPFLGSLKFTSIFQIQGDNLIERLIYILLLIYNTFDIFMIMYFGNEITLASDRLSYALFESDWVDRSQSIKKKVFMFGEFLVKPQQMVLLQLYPLTLDTFTRVCFICLHVYFANEFRNFLFFCQPQVFVFESFM